MRQVQDGIKVSSNVPVLPLHNFLSVKLKFIIKVTCLQKIKKRILKCAQVIAEKKIY